MVRTFDKILGARIVKEIETIQVKEKRRKSKTRSRENTKELAAD